MSAPRWGTANEMRDPIKIVMQYLPWSAFINARHTCKMWMAQSENITRPWHQWLMHSVVKVAHRDDISCDRYRQGYKCRRYDHYQTDRATNLLKTVPLHLQVWRKMAKKRAKRLALLEIEARTSLRKTELYFLHHERQVKRFKPLAAEAAADHRDLERKVQASMHKKRYTHHDF